MWNINKILHWSTCKTIQILYHGKAAMADPMLCSSSVLKWVLCKDQKVVEINSLRFWWNLHKMCLLVQKVKNRYQSCDFWTWLPWKRVMRFWPFLCYLDMKNSQNMHTSYIKYILLCWTRNKSHYIFFMLWLWPQDVKG